MCFEDFRLAVQATRLTGSNWQETNYLLWAMRPRAGRAIRLFIAAAKLETAARILCIDEQRFGLAPEEGKLFGIGYGCPWIVRYGAKPIEPMAGLVLATIRPSFVYKLEVCPGYLQCACRRSHRPSSLS
jgi:hypothetical protein